MSEHWDIYADWNPWHGCTKISPGCKYCYVYRQDEMYSSEIGSDVAHKTANFNLPLKRRRDKSYKIPSGRMVFTCFTSDFLLQDADAWRSECWAMMRERSDLWFYFFTKRIDRFMECIPPDWGDGSRLGRRLRQCAGGLHRRKPGHGRLPPAHLPAAAHQAQIHYRLTIDRGHQPYRLFGRYDRGGEHRGRIRPRGAPLPLRMGARPTPPMH